MTRPVFRTITHLLVLGLVVVGTAATLRGDEREARRRALLRDSSDLGIGLSLGRYRGHVPSGRLAPRRDFGLPLSDFQYGLYRYGYGYGAAPGFYQGSNLFDWQAPQILRHGDHWHIEPGYFDNSATANRWHR